MVVLLFVENSTFKMKQFNNTFQAFFYYCMRWILFDLILHVPVNNFSDMSGRVFLGWTST